MYIGASHPCIARISTESTSALPVYNTGSVLGYIAKSDIAFEFASGEAFGSNALRESLSEFIRGTCSLEMLNISAANKVVMYGATLATNEVGYGAEDSQPYLGYAFYRTMSVDNVKYYEAYYFPKVKAVPGQNIAAETKGRTFVMTNPPAVLEVFKPQYGKYMYTEIFATEALAQAYVETKVNVTTPDALVLSSSVPADTVVGVAVDASIVLTFNNQIASEAIVAYDWGVGAFVTTGKAWDATGKILTISHVADFSTGGDIEVTIAGVKDIYGQELAPALLEFETVGA